MNDKRHFDSLDSAKWICALLIILIHTEPLASIPVVTFYAANVLARIAVPLFFSISGFLFFRKIMFKNGKIARSSQNLADAALNLCFCHFCVGKS